MVTFEMEMSKTQQVMQFYMTGVAVTWWASLLDHGPFGATCMALVWPYTAWRFTSSHFDKYKK